MFAKCLLLIDLPAALLWLSAPPRGERSTSLYLLIGILMDKQYLALVRDVLERGSWQDNRTGVRTKSLPGAMMRFDMREGFPAITTKRLAFKSVAGELVGFLRGYESAADFRALGCKVWDQNANENKAWLENPWRDGEDSLGPVYGSQWRNWPAYKLLPANAAARIAAAKATGYKTVGALFDQGEPHLLLYKAIDQLRQCADMIMNDPGSRRILFHGWNCAQLEEMALPPCHLLYQFLANATTRELSLCLYIRSNDLGLGAPFNVASAAVLLHLMARLTGYEPRIVSYFVADAHIYENHMEMLEEQLKRVPYELPQLQISSRVPAFSQTGEYAPEWLAQVEPEDFLLVGYQHHPPITAAMAV